MRTTIRPLRVDPSPLPARIGVCIIISDPLLAQRMTLLLSGDKRFEVSFDPSDSRDFDVILADHVRMLPGPSIIIDDGAQSIDADADVRAVLPPSVDGDLLRAAIRIVSAGLMIAEADEPSRFADGSSGFGRSLAADDAGIALTARESEVVGLLAHGASNKSIARELDISVHTAKFHVASVLAKLCARNRSDAVAIGIRRGLVLL
jgi:two-component system, NarL family, nitrate/nitrite response regulator NarL